MRGFLAAQWRAFEGCYDAPAAAVQSGPGAWVAPVTLAVAMLVIGHVPALAARAQFGAPFLPAALMLIGGFCSFTAWRHKATGRLGTACMLLDTFFYSSGFAFAAALSHGGFGVGFAVGLALFHMAFPARVYGLNLLIGLAMCAGPLTAIVALPGDEDVDMVLGASCLMAIVLSYRTSQRQALEAQNVRLRTALGAADRIADQSVEVALASSLLSLGHFLHELRNGRAAIGANIAYVLENAALTPECREALEDAQTSQQAEDLLITRMLAELRSKASAPAASFVVQDVVASVAGDVTDIQVEVRDEAPRIEIDGPPEQLRLVLQNLTRNAAQAGARHARITIRPHETAAGVVLEVADDGPGLPPDVAREPFRPFATSRADGTGLGLYLSRRYVELMRGQIAIAPGPHAGAAFVIRLPARVAALQAPPTGGERDGGA
jgi:signal transduction histidine kinase